MFTGFVILSEIWTRKSCVTSDLKAEYCHIKFQMSDVAKLVFISLVHATFPLF